MSRANRGTLILGGLLIVLGLIFLLNNFNLVPANYLQWWPVVILAAGLWLFGRGALRRDGTSLVAGTVVATLGGFWLLDSLGRVDERLFVPILVIALGAGLLLRSLFAARR